MLRIAILAYGSLIDDPGDEIEAEMPPPGTFWVRNFSKEIS